MGEVLSQKRAMRNLVQNDQKPITFKKTGLIPLKKFLWNIEQWITRGEPASFITLENIRSKRKGGFLSRVDKTYGSKYIMKQICPGNAKNLMGYMLDRDMSEGEILQSASDLHIRRLQIDASGVQIFNLIPGQKSSDSLRLRMDKEVDAHDLFRIAHQHEYAGDGYGIKLPMHTHIHFFPDVVKMDQESGKLILTATHASLRATPEGIIASASRFSSNHIMRKGDICVFAPHEQFIQKIR